MFAGFLQSQGDVPALKLAQRDAVARVECFSTTESTEDTEPEGQGVGFAVREISPEAPTPGPDGPFRPLVRSSIPANHITSTDESLHAGKTGNLDAETDMSCL